MGLFEHTRTHWGSSKQLLVRERFSIGKKMYRGFSRSLNLVKNILQYPKELRVLFKLRNRSTLLGTRHAISLWINWRSPTFSSWLWVFLRRSWTMLFGRRMLHPPRFPPPGTSRSRIQTQSGPCQPEIKIFHVSKCHYTIFSFKKSRALYCWSIQAWRKWKKEGPGSKGG